jgi:Tol biopolymer transport system component
MMKTETGKMMQMGMATALASAMALVALLLALVGTAKEAEATFLGENGKIAFASNRTSGEGVNNPEGDFEIFTMNSAGTELVQLTQNAAFDFDPEWSPDGRKIAFVSDRDFAPGVYTMNADGTKQRKSSRGSPVAFASPGWSPDGARVAFTNDQEGGNDVYVMRANGAGQKRLTVNGLPTDSGPVFSPDGAQTAFQSNRDGIFEIYTMSPNGEGQINLTNDPAADLTPDWQPQ